MPAEPSYVPLMAGGESIPTSIDYARREISMKILFCGPDYAGKSTSLMHIYEHADPQRRGKLISLATVPRTVMFDFVPLDLATIRGFRVRLHVHEVPAGSDYANTWKLLFKAVAGVVFVADSSVSRLDANLESLNEVRGMLAGSGTYDVPLVFQYNKRDLQDILSIENLRSRLNSMGAPETETVATQGLGVWDCLMGIVQPLLPHLS